jgi:glutamate synthase domain-containing protein 2
LGAPGKEDIKLAIEANPDIIAIDGTEGGTGAAPEVMLDEVGIPTLACLVNARKILNEMGALQELWIGGGLQKGGDFAKALALGADAVFCATPLLIAKGIATQDPKLRKNLNIKEASQNVANYIKNCTEEIKMIAGACGKNDVHHLSKEDLRALNLQIAKITGVKFINE